MVSTAIKIGVGILAVGSFIFVWKGITASNIPSTPSVPVGGVNIPVPAGTNPASSQQPSDKFSKLKEDINSPAGQQIISDIEKSLGIKF